MVNNKDKSPDSQKSEFVRGFFATPLSLSRLIYSVRGRVYVVTARVLGVRNEA